MEHSFLDRYSNKRSLIHQIEPRIKIIVFFTYILCVVLTSPRQTAQFLAYFVLIFAVAIISCVSLFYILKHSLIIIPFAALTAIFIPFFKEGKIAGSYNLGIFELTLTYNGLWILWGVLIKSWLSVLAMIILSSTTKFADLLKGAEKLYIPRIFLMMLSFMYRYIFVLIGEAMRMRRAWESRYFGGRIIAQVKVFANFIAMLFIRAFERGERVYIAMCSRGFEGKINTLNLLQIRLLDICFAAVFFTILLIIKLL